jgi:hypothetical protein
MRAGISTCEFYGNARFSLCCYEYTFLPTNRKTESIYMQKGWVTVNIFIGKVIVNRTEMVKLKFKNMQIFLSYEMVESACGSGKRH